MCKSPPHEPIQSSKTQANDRKPHGYPRPCFLWIGKSPHRYARKECPRSPKRIPQKLYYRHHKTPIQRNPTSINPCNQQNEACKVSDISNLYLSVRYSHRKHEAPISQKPYQKEQAPLECALLLEWSSLRQSIRAFHTWHFQGRSIPNAPQSTKSRRRFE